MKSVDVFAFVIATRVRICPRAVIKPPARLEPRNESERVISDAQDGDGRDITYEQLKTISIFKDVKYERVDLRALPGTIVLRRFQAGEDICLQDDPGYTAFYVLTAKEIGDLKLTPLPEHTVPADQTLAIMRAAAGGAKKAKTPSIPSRWARANYSAK